MPPIYEPLQMRAAVRGSVLNVDVLGPIDDSLWFGDETTPTTVAAALQRAKDEGAKSIHLRVNSPGGSVFAGVAMYHLLRASTLPVEATVLGIAASAASVVLLAADVRRVPAGAYVMIHRPWSLAVGTSDEMRKSADLLDTITEGLLDIYESRTSLSREDLRAMVDEETWIDGARALSMGFATDEVEMDVAASVAQLGDDPRIPQALRERLAAVRPPAATVTRDDRQMTAATLRHLRTACAGNPARLDLALEIAEAHPDDLPETILAQADERLAIAAQAEAAARVPQLEASLTAARAEIETLRGQVATLTAERDNARAAASLGAQPVETEPPAKPPAALSPLDRIAAEMRVRS
jgi:ATP-dependent Clp protease, protease subunit